jgi:hypothetical protein
MTSLEFFLYRMLLESVPVGQVDALVTQAESCDLATRQRLSRMPMSETETAAANLAEHFARRLMVGIEEDEEG